MAPAFTPCAAPPQHEAMPKPRKPIAQDPGVTNPGGLLMEAEALLERLTLGTWVPNLDLCETGGLYTVRVELPGVDLGDVSLSIQDGILRVTGTKREPAIGHRMLCYYCLERRYGRFQREVRFESVVDARRTTARLEDGVLTVALPKLIERRGQVVQIPIVGKKR